MILAGILLTASIHSFLQKKNRFFCYNKTSRTRMSFIIFCPFSKSSDDANDSMWMAVSEDTGSWTFVDLGKSRNIKCSEVYFILPAAGHAYVLEYSTDGKIWKSCGGHPEVVIQSPHTDILNIKARYLRVKILNGINGIWEWHIY